MDAVTEIGKFIKELVGEQFEADEPLLMTHCIDSMDVVETASWMEKQFDISIQGDEVTFGNFDTIRKMGDFVLGKMERK